MSAPLINEVGDIEAVPPIVPHQTRRNWLGRKLTCCCGGNYTSDTKFKVEMVGLTVMGIGFAILLAGAVWNDSLDDTQKGILTGVGGGAVLIGGITHGISALAYKLRPSNSI